MDKLYKILFGSILLVLFLSQVVSAAGPAAVNLGSSGSFAILAKSGISTTGTTLIVGDIGVSPIDSTSITGFGLILDSSTQFATSSLVTGKAYAADYAPPTPTKMTTAVSDMETAYTDAAGRTNPTATELGAGNIGGMTLASGLYKWSTGLTIPTSVTLSGGSNDVWIFQIAQNLDVGDGTVVILSGGAQAQNIFWQVAGQATLGTTSDVKGIILSQTAIVLNTGAKLNGRALAQTAVTLDANAVTAPTGSGAPAPTPSSTATPTPSATPTTTPTPTATPTGTTPTPTLTGTTSAPTPKPTATPRPSFTPTATITPTTPVGGSTAHATTIGGSSGSTTTPSPTTANTWSKLADLGSAIPQQLNGVKENALIAAAIIVISAAGLYYYFKVMKK
ncbi:MAG: ice-binding family protein [Candidatus Micrarchaeota archaeon]